MNISLRGKFSFLSASLLVSLLSLIVSIVIFSLAVLQVFSMRTSAIAAMEELVKNTSREVALSVADSLAKETQAPRAALATLVIPQNGTAAFITSIEGLAQDAGVVAKTSSVSGKPTKGDTPGALVMSLQFSGTFVSMMNFVRLLETLDVSGSVSGFSFQYDTTDKKWNGTITISVLSFDTPS